MNNEFDIAIVGMAGRFPGARNLDEFWRNLASGVESITRFSDHEILESGVSVSCLSNTNYVKAAPVLDQPGHFDAEFFGFSPMEARAMDPQQRILLELAYEALENAAYDPNRYQGRIGVFSGAAMNTYFMNVGLSNRFAEEYIPTLIGNDKDFLSTRISYKLNLKGPSITVQTACSTSMVAVHLACQSLLSQETDMALAGAISVRVPHRAGYFCDGGGVVSPDARVRAFDANANGTVFGSGGGILVLKRLADALADGDTIRAVIKGSAVNNDGSEKAGYTAPSVNSQADVVVEALANAGIDADSISYIEAHGSGTPVGDPIEVRALTKAFRTFTRRSEYCAIGSVKTNVGHLDAAAAVAGIIKTVLALEHREIPASLNFTNANPEVDFRSTPFYVNTQLREWATDSPRRAGVMSTGIGGTNAHVVLEQAPDAVISSETRPSHLLVLSAKTETALDQATSRLREFLDRNKSVNMEEVGYTLQIGRKEFPHRRYVFCANREDAIATLGQTESKRIVSNLTDESQRPVILLLPGVGDQYVGMGYGLCERWPIFKQELERCAEILRPHLGVDIRDIIYPRNQKWKSNGKPKGIDLKQMLGRNSDALQDEDACNLNRTLFVQPALFAIEYAMARLWESFGITPAAIVGHSMGEYVAACLAGVLSLEDALRLVAFRARLANELPKGAMLAVTLPENELVPLLPEDLSISLINGPRLSVVAGPVNAVVEFERTLTAKNIICRHVQNGHAFHSRMIEPIVKPFETEIKKVRLEPPKTPYISNVTGTWIKAFEATNPRYWSSHATRTARFADALRQLQQFQNPILLEAGPGRTLGVLAMQNSERREGGSVAVSSIRHDYEHQSDAEFLLNAVGRLWSLGARINWNNVHNGERRRRVALPTYPFERQNYWLEPKPAAPGKQNDESRGIEHWFYVPTWKRALAVNKVTNSDTLWLIFSDRSGEGACLKAHLDGLGLPNCFVRLKPDLDYLKLFEQVRRDTPKTINIIHLGSVNADGDQELGFYSLLQIAQAIGELNISVPINIGIVSNQIHDVTGEERLTPEMATVLGPCGVIPKEFPNIKCFNIDLPDRQPIDTATNDTITSVVSEFNAPTNNTVIAYRGRYRWERDFKPVNLPRSGLGRLKRGGAYLITGGTGGIGLSIAKYLARACQPKIVLTKKTPFPEKSAWKQLLNTREASESVLRTISALLEIQELGAEIEVQVAEVSNRAQTERVLNDTVRRFGTINGIIHAAGIVSTGLIGGKTKQTAESVLDPKVQGTILLFDLIKDLPLDFLVLFSSMTSIETPYAQCDYSGANAFLDAFTYAANATANFHTLTINWPGWKEVGLLANLQMPPGMEGWKAAALEKSITPEDGVEVFRRALASDLKQVIVSPEDLGQVVDRSRSPVDPASYLSQARPAQTPRPRRTRRNGAAKPTNEVEAAVGEIWCDVFGFEDIAIDENFSQLGGHSLLAMQIVSKIRALYEIRFSLREFFEAPTIAGLSSLIQGRILSEVENLTDDQARQLVLHQ